MVAGLSARQRKQPWNSEQLSSRSVAGAVRMGGLGLRSASRTVRNKHCGTLNTCVSRDMVSCLNNY